MYHFDEEFLMNIITVMSVRAGNFEQYLQVQNNVAAHLSAEAYCMYLISPAKLSSRLRHLTYAGIVPLKPNTPAN